MAFVTYVFWCSFLPLIQSEIEVNLIIEYFHEKNRNEITIFTCENTKMLKNLLSTLMEQNIYVSVIDLNYIDNIDVKNLSIPHGSQGIVLDIDCENSAEILYRCGDHALFFDKYAWLIFSSNGTAVSVLRNVTLHLNADVVVAQLEEDNWRLLDVYNPGALLGGTLKTSILGSWTGQEGFSWEPLHTLPKYLVRTDMTEITFKGMVVLAEGYKGELFDYLYHNEDNIKADNYARYYFILFDHVRDLYKFNLTVQVTGFFGTASPNGSFNGLVGALQRKEVDVGLSPLYFKIDRLPNVDTLVTTYLMTTRFIFRHPKPGISLVGAFFDPLDGTVWLVTWGIMFLTALIIRATFREEWLREREQGDTVNYMEHDWSYVALLVFGGVCQQDVPRVPNMYSGRIIVFISVFFTYMLYQFYSGIIVSSLLSEPPRTIRTLEDLLHSDLAVGVEDIPYEKMYFDFDNTSDPIAVELFKKKMVGKKNGSTAWYGAVEGMQLVQRGGFALQTDISTAYSIMGENFTNEEICEVSDEVMLFPLQKMAGAVQQDSPFKEIFIYNFMRMGEAGMIQRMQVRWTTPKIECIKVNDASSIFVSIKEFFPALLFYMVGIVITMIIFLGEIWVHHKQQNNTRYSKHCRKHPFRFRR